jgi:hypothetical protein
VLKVGIVLGHDGFFLLIARRIVLRWSVFFVVNDFLIKCFHHFVIIVIIFKCLRREWR